MNVEFFWKKPLYSIVTYTAVDGKAAATVYDDQMWKQ